MRSPRCKSSSFSKHTPHSVPLSIRYTVDFKCLNDESVKLSKSISSFRQTWYFCLASKWPVITLDPKTVASFLPLVEVTLNVWRMEAVPMTSLLKLWPLALASASFISWTMSSKSSVNLYINLWSLTVTPAPSTFLVVAGEHTTSKPMILALVDAA